MKRFLFPGAVMSMLLLIGCGSDPPVATQPRTEEECNGLMERADGWLDGVPEMYEEVDRDDRRRNACDHAFAYKKGVTLQIEAIKCTLDLKKDTMPKKQAKSMRAIIPLLQRDIKERTAYAKEYASCPELTDW